jgi:hypothetical protein
VGIVAYAAYDRRLVDYLRALTVVSYGTFLDAGLHVSSDSIATCWTAMLACFRSSADDVLPSACVKLLEMH